MTVTYTSKVTTCRGISSFLRLLARWRGSIYKIVWVDLLLFLGLYYILNLPYRFLFDDDSKKWFEKLVKYCDKYASLIPLSFVLGFYVNLVMTRWWSQYCSIPFPDNLAILVGASIKGQNTRAKVIRRTIVRYVCVTFTITLTMISPKVKKRFPTLEHFVDAGLLTKDEKKIMEDLDNEFPSYSKYWLPLAWASNIITRGRHEGLVRDDVSVKTLLEELNLFRSRCGTMLDYDWISVPLVYTQVVTLAVYAYFIIAAIGRQYIEPINDELILDLYFPFLPVLEFFFYMGWLKVAEVLINPYGEDDDDFEVVWMVDRHLQVSYLLVDKIHEQHPKLMRDVHWSEAAPNSLPYTVASKSYMQEYPCSSTLNVTVNKSEQDLIMPVIDEISQPDGTKRRRGSHLWKQLRRDRRAIRNEVNLQNVVSHSQDIEEVNEYDESVDDKGNDTKVIKYCEEFERLKRLRQEQHKRRLLKLLEFTTKREQKDLVNIVDDIVK